MSMMQGKNSYWIILIIVLILTYFVYASTVSNPLVVPEAGYCIEKDLPTKYTTITHANGTKENYEYCPLQTFCDEYMSSTVVEGEPYNQTLLNNVKTNYENRGYECFMDEAPHTQRETNIFLGENEELVTKFVCCTDLNLEDESCLGNTCDGRYMGLIDMNGCRIYAVELGFNEEGIMKITTCGGDYNTVSP